MAKQKPPNSAGKLTGYPYKHSWEVFGESWEPLYLHGLEREQIRQSFARARKAGANDLYLTKKEVRKIIAPLKLSSRVNRELADKLYHYAGHYNSPRFHKLDGDAPAQVPKLLMKVVNAAVALDKAMGQLTPDVWRYVGGARWKLGKRRKASPELDWSALQNQITDLANSARMVAAEFPKFGRGTSEKALLGRWLRHSAAALELATGTQIQTKTSNSAGRHYRMEGVEGEVFQKYATRVDKGLAPKTIIMAVREYQQHGVAGRTRKPEIPKKRQLRAKIAPPGPLASEPRARGRVVRNRPK
jgi:hypothetical protein